MSRYPASGPPRGRTGAPPPASRPEASGSGTSANAYAAMYEALGMDSGPPGAGHSGISGGSGGRYGGGSYGGAPASSVRSRASAAAPSARPAAAVASARTMSVAARPRPGGAVAPAAGTRAPVGAGHAAVPAALAALAPAAPATRASAAPATRVPAAPATRTAVATRPALDAALVRSTTAPRSAPPAVAAVTAGRARPPWRGADGMPLYDDDKGGEAGEDPNAPFVSSDRSAWAKGPVDTLPCSPRHDRPVFDLCISPARNMVVSASADHGLRVFNLATGRLERELFTKTAGHKEWVTTCDIAHHSGRVLSGGMDFAVCVWEANSTKCGFIGPFDGPVTKVSADDGWRAMTSSMDGSVKLWDIRSTHSARELQSYTGHSKGATTFRWTSTFCVSAERGGQLHVWDLETAQATHVLPAHTGAVVNALQLLSDPAAGAVSGSPFSERVVPNLIVSGGTDGYLRVYDLRTDRVVSQRRISGGRTGAGAVSDIAVWGWGAGAAEARADVVAYEVAARPSACDTDPGHAYDGTDSVDAGDGQRDYSQYGAQPVSYAGRGGAAVAGGMSDYLIAAGLTDGAVTVIDPRRSFMSTLSLQGPRAPVMAVRVAPSGRHVIATTADGACYAWDVRQSVPEREQPRLGAAPPPVPCRNPSWGMGVTEGPNSEEAHAVVRGGNGGRAVGCLQVWAGGAVCAGEDGQPLILTMG